MLPARHLLGLCDRDRAKPRMSRRGQYFCEDFRPHVLMFLLLLLRLHHLLLGRQVAAELRLRGRWRYSRRCA